MINQAVSRVLGARFWISGHASCLARQVYNRARNSKAGWSDQDHLLRALDWLEHAQDVTGDGGVCGRYHLGRGWTSSYPETTGYIIPTFLNAARVVNQPRYVERAARSIEFLLPLQLPSGAFPGGEVHENRTEPSPFNTAQILTGLIAWHNHSGDARALDAATRAGEWLIKVQDDDGAWRRHYYLGVAATYAAHACCWLAELGQYLGEKRFLDAAERNLDWHLRYWNSENGWIDRCGFLAADHEARRAVTHTIAYTHWGVLMTAEILGRQDGIAAVALGMEQVVRHLEITGWIPGYLNHRWRGDVDWACLTGNSQFSLIWLRLFRITGDARYMNGALRAIDLVKQAQLMDNPNPDLRGGVTGADPIWGQYITMCVPNWAVKFHADSLMEKSAAIVGLSERRRGRWNPPADLPESIPAAELDSAVRRPSVLVYTRANSPRLSQLAAAWEGWGFQPDAVVFHVEFEKPAWERILRKIKDTGAGWILDRLLHGHPAAVAAATLADGLKPAREYCQSAGIQVVEAGSLGAPETLASVRELRPDLAIYAGGGILRKDLLAVPTLGTLNVHMGILPHYRGMNVAEWAAFNGDPVGITVHWVDPGVDTGEVLYVRRLEGGPWRSLDDLRAAVDALMVGCLGEVVKALLAGITLPKRKQTVAEGVQYFRMHEDLRALLTEELHRAAQDRPGTV